VGWVDIYSYPVYMNESWNTLPLNTAMLLQRKAPEEVSQSELDSLLRGRRFGVPKEPEQFNMTPAIPEYGEEDMQELQDFCSKRGIIGVNFNGMNPKAVLKMLKSRMGITEQTSKRGILNG